MKGISKTNHAGLSPLIPAVLAPPEVLIQAALGFIPPPIKPTGTSMDSGRGDASSVTLAPRRASTANQEADSSNLRGDAPVGRVLFESGCEKRRSITQDRLR